MNITRKEVIEKIQLICRNKPDDPEIHTDIQRIRPAKTT